MGKEFSANQFQNLFNDIPVKKEEASIPISIKPQQEKPSSPSLNMSGVADAVSGLSGIFDIEPQGDNYEDIAFAKEKEWEDKKRKQKTKRRKPGRQM